MGWHETRVRWNREGKCAREACKTDLDRNGEYEAYRHPITNLLYCRSCMIAIKRACVGSELNFTELADAILPVED